MNFRVPQLLSHHLPAIGPERHGAVAGDRDHRIVVGPGDTVLLASSLIPGNENAVYRVINGLMRLGAHVVHKGNAKVHVSGHAAAGELTYCYNIVRPRNVLPVHGEWRHMFANGELAVATGVPRERVLLAEDGVVVDLQNGVAKIVGAVPCGYIYVDGSSVGGTDEALLKDRRILRDEGFITCIVVIDAANTHLPAVTVSPGSAFTSATFKPKRSGRTCCSSRGSTIPETSTILPKQYFEAFSTVTAAPPHLIVLRILG